MTTTTDRPDQKTAPGRRRPPRWMLVVSALLVMWLGAQVVAGWKFANGRSYPVVGSAMFNGPPTGAGPDFMVPRVFAITASGERVEMDQHTFGLEPFEWRRWIKRNLEDVGDEQATRSADALEDVFAEQVPGSPPAVAIELWRVPALDEHLGNGRLIRTVPL